MVLYLIIALDFSFQKVGGNLIDDGAINHTTKAIGVRIAAAFGNIIGFVDARIIFNAVVLVSRLVFIGKKRHLCRVLFIVRSNPKLRSAIASVVIKSCFSSVNPFIQC